MNLDQFILSLTEYEKDELCQKLLVNLQKPRENRTDLRNWFIENKHLLSVQLLSILTSLCNNIDDDFIVMEKIPWSKVRNLGIKRFTELKELTEKQNIFLKE
ncbi:hypothetical protein [Bizionia myxarmorum]|uniref:Uncharacterized protein n=1 Tax=Bizionia myxarmorum TaxID=291186 RepID=A0A5D0RBQ5_9FLAO|nr:hypothetical protein [Bizionia myxarmorum]TYB78316.1 hypothetical protein ES674_00620 [Bizionia myxarmorum]